MDDKAILSTVDNLQRIFSIVLALSLAEAFKQFVADKDRTIHWDRLMALGAFLLLLVPFYHGMGRYFYEVYRTSQRPQPYSVFLIIDSLAFMLEASVFFVMSRSLPLIQWRRFYVAVIAILSIDTVWGFIVWLTHRQAIIEWLILNAFSLPAFIAIVCCFRNEDSRWGPILALVAMSIRTVVDYLTSWGFYFPPAAIAR